MALSKQRKKLISLIMGLVLLSGITAGCSRSSSTTADDSAAAISSLSVDFDSEDLDSSWDSTKATRIILTGDQINVTGSGAVASGSTVTIQAGGVYVVSGSLSNGQLSVNSSDKNTVKLVLNEVDIANPSTSPIYIQNAEKTIITLAANTTNTITDGSGYSQADASSDEPNADIFSHDDLTINGTGSLTVNGNYKHGIVCNDDLKIVSGTITVKSVSDGIKGKDSVAVRDGNIIITAGSDGIQSTNDTDAAKGWVYIANGNIKITSALDGIQAATCVDIENGNIIVNSGGGSQNGINHTPAVPGANRTQVTAATDTESTKGIKAGSNIIIAGGNIVANTADDAINANASIAVNGGILTIDSGDDGIHADTSLVFNGGDLTINKSYEGIESAAITINNGNFHITASDDGINTSGGSDGSSVNGRPGQNNFDASDGSKLNIAGGYIYVNAQGDGIDVNGDWVMSGGQVIVNGPTNDGNGALDCNGAFALNGGFLVAAGSAGMAEAPDDSSAQASLKLNLGIQPAGTIVRIVNAKGDAILTFTPLKDYASVVVSSSELSKGSTYTIYTGGSCSGDSQDGLYTGGTYTGGTQGCSIQQTSMVTSYGQSGNILPGGPGGGTGRNPGSRP